jgi:hypothetical protein
MPPITGGGRRRGDHQSFVIHHWRVSISRNRDQLIGRHSNDRRGGFAVELILRPTLDERPHR